MDAVTRKITDVNPFMVELLGYATTSSWARNSLKSDCSRMSGESGRSRSCQENGYIRYEDLPLQTKWGKRREVEFVSNVYAENGHQVIQCNIRDITERKRDERALRAGADHSVFGRFHAPKGLHRQAPMAR